MTSGEQRERVATTVLFRSGEDERVNESNPSKASVEVPAYMSDFLVAIVFKLNMHEPLFSFNVPVKKLNQQRATTSRSHCVHMWSPTLHEVENCTSQIVTWDASVNKCARTCTRAWVLENGCVRAPLLFVYYILHLV
jgi:hypothetical protein